MKPALEIIGDIQTLLAAWQLGAISDLELSMNWKGQPQVEDLVRHRIKERYAK